MAQLARIGVTANEVTVVTCIASVLLGSWLCFQKPKWMLALPVFFFARMAMNAVDGMLAREFGQKSRLGTYLNELCDVVADVFLYLPFAFLPGFRPFWMGVVILLAGISEMTGVVAVMAGASRRYDGPMGKSDRAFVFGALALWAGLGLSVSPFVAALFSLAVGSLLVITILNRVRNGLAEADQS